MVASQARRDATREVRRSTESIRRSEGQSSGDGVRERGR